MNVIRSPRISSRMFTLGMPASRKAGLALLVLSTLLAGFLRLYELDQIPPGYTFDEAAHALDALDILNGRLLLVSPRLLEAPAGYSYLLAVAFYLFGASPLVHRTVIALCGVLLIPVNFLAVLQVFGKRPDRKATWLLGGPEWLLAGFSSLLLSTSLWAVLTSRIGFEYILPPITAMAAAALFWHSYPRPRWGLVFVAAIFAAGTYYLYNAALPFLLVIPATVLVHKLVARLGGPPNGPLHRGKWLLGGPPRAEVSWQVLIFFTAATLALAAPLLLTIYDWSNLNDQRSVNSTILFDSEHPIQQLVESLWAHARTFAGIDGDEYWWRGLPVLSPVLGLCLAGGLLISLRRVRQLPYLFVLVYWVGMLCAPLFTFDGSVRHFRMAGALPPTYWLIGIAWVELYRQSRLAGRRLERFLAGVPQGGTGVPQGRTSAIALVPFLVAGLIWLPLQTYRDYFITWAHARDLDRIHDVPSVRLVERMERETDPGVVFVLPRSAAAPRPNFILDLLYSGRAPLRYLIMDEATLYQVLTQELAGYRRVHLITWLGQAREEAQRAADAGGLLPLLLTQHGELSGVEETEDYVILTYTLDSDRVVFHKTPVEWQIPADFKPLAMGAGGLKLAGYRQRVQGDGLLVDLAWQRQGEVLNDYTVFLQLLDGSQQRVTGVDAAPDRSFRSLALNEVMLTSYHIPIPAGTAPGSYTLRVGLYYFSEDQTVNLGAAALPEPVVLNSPDSPAP